MFETLLSLDSQLMALGTKVFVAKEEAVGNLRYEATIKKAEHERKKEEKEKERKAKEKEEKERKEREEKEEAKKAEKVEDNAESEEEKEEEDEAPVKGESYLEACLRRHAELNLPEGEPPLPVASAYDDEEEFVSIEDIQAAIERHEEETNKSLEEIRAKRARLMKALEDHKNKKAEEEKKAEAEESIEDIEKRLREDELQLAKMIKELQDKTTRDREKLESLKKQKVEDQPIDPQTAVINGPDFSEFIRQDGNGNPINTKKPVTPEDVDAALAASTGKKKK